MNIDPKYRFLIGLCVTFAIGVSQGTVSLTNAIPDGFIKPVVAWCGILAFLGSAATTAISGLGMTNSSRAAAAQSLPDETKIALAADTETAKQIITTPEVAAAIPSPKVVSAT
jgi:hypothetical protein